MAEGNRYREAITNSSALSKQNQHDQALNLLDESIAEAVREGQTAWVRTLCHHAAVISEFSGKVELKKHYYEQSLASDPENPRALYGLARIAAEQGEVGVARQYAARCYKTLVESDDYIMREGLLDLVVKHWPELVGK